MLNDKKIKIAVDSQAVLKAIQRYKLNSKTISRCQDDFIEMGEYNKVRAPHTNLIISNETAEELAKDAAIHGEINTRECTKTSSNQVGEFLKNEVNKR